MANNLYKKDIQSLVHTAQTLAQAAEGDPGYGLSAGAVGAIRADAETVEDLALQYVQMEAALRGLGERRADARAALIARLAMTAKGLEASPGVSDAMLRKAALSARPAKGVRPTSLAAPEKLVAQGTSEGTLALRWRRTNATRTGFLVEVSEDGVAWNYLATTTRTSLSRGGFAPGKAVWARVFAISSNLSSPASNVASLYEPADSAIRAAA